MQLVSQEEWVPMQSPKTIFGFPEWILASLDISLKDSDVAHEKEVLWGPN